MSGGSWSWSSWHQWHGASHRTQHLPRRAKAVLAIQRVIMSCPPCDAPRIMMTSSYDVPRM
eukprot:8435583-Prorocentrum_lima.AAC.1